MSFPLTLLGPGRRARLSNPSTILVPSEADKLMVLGANRIRWFWVVLFLFALSVRLYRVDWDQHHFFHPDERAIGFAVDRLSFSPLQLNPHFFAYGSFLLYVIKGVTSLLGNFRASLRGFDASVMTGRAISALWGAATAVLIGILGARLYGRRIGLLAGVLLAATVLHVQNSHFATSDIPLTFLVLLALYFLVRALETGSLFHSLAAGFSAGLSIATKFSALPILLPIGIVILYRLVVEGWRPRTLLKGAAILLLVAVGFALGQPYAILDFHAFKSDILEQSRMVRHAGLLPYTNQYVGVPKYLYDLQEMVLWGMGPLLGLAAVVGTLICGLRTIRERGIQKVLLFFWVIPFFAITGSFDVKFPRYLLPIYPLLVLWGVVWLQDWAAKGRAGRIARGLVVASTFLWLAAFLRIYTRPHSEVTASEWFYSNVASGTKAASQDWDEGFPFPLPGGLNPERYRIVNLSYYEPDSPGKIAHISEELASSDYAVFQTKRIYGAVTRAAEKFPLTNRYFRRLFAGDLGFRLVKDFASRPALFGIEVPDELADESFSVYDHPKILIFRNTQRLAANILEQRILNGAPSRLLSRRDLLLASVARSRSWGAAGSPPEPIPPAVAPAPTVYVAKEAAGAGPLDQPRGVAIDTKGRVLVCDFGHGRIQGFDKTLKPVLAWGRPGKGPGEFNQPGALAVGPDGKICVSDTWNNRIQEFDEAGDFRNEWKDDFFGPRGVAIGHTGQIFVADTGNHRIVRFSPKGEKEMQWGGLGRESGKLSEPMGLAVAKDGRVFVCDNGNGRMQIFDTNGRSLSTFEVPGWRREVFSEPQVVLDGKNTPWVTVPLEKEIRHYGADGKLLQSIRGGQTNGQGFERPMGIAIDSSAGVLFVSDLSGRLIRLQIPHR